VLKCCCCCCCRRQWFWRLLEEDARKCALHMLQSPRQSVAQIASLGAAPRPALLRLINARASVRWDHRRIMHVSCRVNAPMDTTQLLTLEQEKDQFVVQCIVCSISAPSSNPERSIRLFRRCHLISASFTSFVPSTRSKARLPSAC
jgi:hypothetical protein